MKNNRFKYELRYPHYLDPRKRVWVAVPGERVLFQGQEGVIKQILKSRLKGSSPRVVIEVENAKLSETPSSN